MKKKLIGLFLASAMVASLAGCGKEEPVTITPAENVTEEASVEAVEEEVEESVEEATTEEVEAEDAATEATSEAAEESADGFTTGTVTGNVYENEFFNVKFEVPESYTFMDDETLASLSGYASDVLSDNKAAQKALEEGTAAIVAYATDASTGNNINVTIQSNLSLQNALLDEEAIISANATTLKTTLEAQGLTVDSLDIVKGQFAGDEHSILKLAGSANGVQIFEQMAILQKDDYIVAFAATAVGEDITDDLMGAVEKIN